MANKKYYSHSPNRTPDSRRQLRRFVEDQPVTTTDFEILDTPGKGKIASTERDVSLQDYEDIPTPAFGMIFGIHAKTFWGIIGGVIVSIGIIFGIIVYFNSIAANIATNTANIQSIKDQFVDNNKNFDDKINKVENTLNERINDIINFIKK